MTVLVIKITCLLPRDVHCHVPSLTHRILTTRESGECDLHLLPPGYQKAGWKGVGVTWGMVLTEEWFCPSRILDNVWRHFWLSQLSGYNQHLVGRGQWCYWNPTEHRKAPHNKELFRSNSNSSTVEKPCSSHTDLLSITQGHQASSYLGAFALAVHPVPQTHIYAHTCPHASFYLKASVQIQHCKESCSNHLSSNITHSLLLFCHCAILWVFFITVTVWKFIICLFMRF